MNEMKKEVQQQVMIKMLVIDDESIVLESCRKIFSERGYDVTTTDDPRNGLNLVQEKKYDVILCDWKMPELDGIDVVDMLDKRSPDSAILMISGYPTHERAASAMKRGAVDYVAKPFKPDDIISAVNKALKSKEQQKAERIHSLRQMASSLSFPVPDMEDKSPKTIAETLSQKVGVGKVTSPRLSVLVLGILAGAYIGFGGMLASTVTFDMAKHLGIGFTKFMSGSVFSLGLMLVIIAGAELFTGNNLMVSSVMTRNISFGRMLERWGLVYIANFIGSIIIVLIFVYSGLWKTGDGALGISAVKVASAKVSLSFVEAFIRGIGCNWLVCLAVWMALAARQTIGKIFAIFFPIMGFVAIGFEHSIANMYFIPAGILLQSLFDIAAPAGAGPLNWGVFITRNLIPVTLGNIVGGGVFVAMSYWSVFLRSPGKKAAS